LRKEFALILEDFMERDESIVLMVGDVGFGIFDSIKKRFPKRFLNIGSSEQLMIGIAAGMALEGKSPICYSITPFILYRPFEFIRNFMNEEQIRIKLVGSGRDADYAEAGFTHHAFEVKPLLKVLSRRS
jgi:transketolase